MNNYAFGIPALQHGVIECPNCKQCSHTVIDGNPDDPVRPHVFDRAEIQLPFPRRPMLSDISEPTLARPRGYEHAFSEIIMH